MVCVSDTGTLHTIPTHVTSAGILVPSAGIHSALAGTVTDPKVRPCHIVRRSVLSARSREPLEVRRKETVPCEARSREPLEHGLFSESHPLSSAVLRSVIPPFAGTSPGGPCVTTQPSFCTFSRTASDGREVVRVLGDDDDDDNEAVH